MRDPQHRFVEQTGVARVRSRLLVLLVFFALPGLLPDAALHAEEIRGSHREYDWYKTQFGTGGTGNCGPACAAMVIHWATGGDVTVRTIREEIGKPNGSRATSLAHLKRAVDRHGVRAQYTVLSSPGELRALVDRGSVAILWIHTGRIRKPQGDVTRTVKGRYYDDECGHYIVLKGYTDNGYFIVHDPIPGDWTTNTVRYPDGSMLGRNRWFHAPELWRSLMDRRVIEVFRSPD